MVSDAAATKAPIAKIADKVSGIFVPCVILVAVIVLAIWLLLGKDAGFALTRAISVLVISCPCALGLATPVAIMVGNGKGAKNGILFKTAASLENAGKTQIVALDKTGTITKGEPEVTDIIGDKELIETAYSLEIKSEHPLAKAVVRYGEKNNLSPSDTTGFRNFPGGGLVADQEAYDKGSVSRAELSINQPATPALGYVQVDSLTVAEGVAEWSYTAKSNPQLSFTLAEYDAEGALVAETTVTRPEVTSLALTEKTAKVALTVKDIFGNTVTVKA
jgi:Cu2+-exporting ATPase